MKAQISPEIHLQKRTGLAEELASILMSRLRSGDFKIGDVLPPEKVFAETYQVSRTVVREALARLKYEGIIISKRGSGSVVVGATPNKGFDLEGTGAINSFFEFRMLLDSEAAAMAAVRHTKDHVARLREYLDALEQAGEEQTNNADPDYRFHMIIADASDNEYIKAASQQLSTKMWSHLYKAKMSPHRQQVLAEHALVYKSIVARNPAAARAASLTHLIGSAARRGIELDVRHLIWKPETLSYL